MELLPAGGCASGGPRLRRARGEAAEECQGRRRLRPQPRRPASRRWMATGRDRFSNAALRTWSAMSKVCTTAHPGRRDVVERTSPVSAGPSSGLRLSPATIRQKIVTARLFFEFYILGGSREDLRNPVARGVGAYAEGKRRRGIAPLQQPQPWIPSDETWERIVAHILHRESLRNQAMVLLACSCLHL